MILELAGAPALSAFRIAKLLDRLTALDGAVTGLSARFTHFVEATRELTAAEQDVLARLLTYGPRMEGQQSAGDGELILVVPRAGTDRKSVV